MVVASGYLVVLLIQVNKNIYLYVCFNWITSEEDSIGVNGTMIVFEANGHCWLPVEDDK